MKPSSSKTNGLSYTIVTQVIVSINSSECNVTSVSDMVKTQLGLEVILLDSKLYPSFDNEATSGVEFWKSTRKIIAASRSLYEKLGGVMPGAELNQGEDNLVMTEPSSKKRKMEPEVQLEDIYKKLDIIDAKLSFIDEIKKTFELPVSCKVTRGWPML